MAPLLRYVLHDLFDPPPTASSAAAGPDEDEDDEDDNGGWSSSEEDSDGSDNGPVMDVRMRGWRSTFTMVSISIWRALQSLALGFT